MRHLLLIESAGKLKKLQQILGPDWQVKASFGHVRELAQDGEDALGFDFDGDRVHCRYLPRGSRGKTVLAELRQAVHQADRVFLATDPDREGETIAWHLAEALHLKQPQRITYSEITDRAVQQALAHPRPLDTHLIGAGLARSCLDKLVGFRGSKYIVWALNIGAKSMGRVQSATLHLLCERERAIQTFQPQDYWSIWVDYTAGFRAYYRGQLSDPTSPPPTDDTNEATPAPESDRVTSQAEADRLLHIARTTPHQVVQVQQRPTRQSPPPPFTTSTLQQAAGSRLHWSPQQTMQVAQSLYEAGHITYMRTDSVHLADEFCQAVRTWLQHHDPTNVPSQPTRHRSRQSAQEAHEAIRPTHVEALPQHLQSRLPADQAQLYDLIWHRAVASQCAPAQLEKTRIVSQSDSLYWEARGQVITFPGYSRYWSDLKADSQLLRLESGQPLTLAQAEAKQKQTQPPPRYSEPKLVQLMEQRGIGRPSTYAPTIATLKERQYVHLLKGKLQPTPLGLSLDTALAQHPTATPTAPATHATAPTPTPDRAAPSVPS